MSLSTAFFSVKKFSFLLKIELLSLFSKGSSADFCETRANKWKV